MPFSFEVAPKVLPSPMGSLVGFCDLIIDNKIFITGFKVFRSGKDDSLFIANPSQASKKVDDKTGKTVYFDTVRFVDPKEKEDDWRTPFQTEVYEVMLQEFQAALSGGGNSQSGSTAPTSTKAPATNAGPPRANRKNPLWK